MIKTTFQRRRRLLAQQRNIINQIENDMNNWKTTLIGAMLAALSFVSIYQTNGGDIAHWQQWIIPACIAAIGIVAKDFNVSGRLPILAGLLMTVVSCTNLQRQAALDRIKAAGLRVVEAGGKAAASQAMTEAEAELKALKDLPLRAGASEAEQQARTAAIAEGERLLNELRGQVAKFTWGK